MTPRRRAALLAAGLALLAAWHLVLHGHGRGLPLITDEGEYAVAARAWSGGGLPYRDAFSQKPPMTFLFYRAAAALCSSPESPRAIAAAASVLTLLALFFCAPAAWSAAGRLAGPAAYAALSALPIGDYGFPANTETFVNLFTALAALALLGGMPLLSGLAAGAALATKQTALWTLAGFGALAARDRRGFAPRRLALYLAGAAAVPLFWLAYFAARGALGDYLDQAWLGNARYAAVLARSGALESQLRWFASALLPKLLLFSAPALALGYWSLSGRQAGTDRPVETLAVVWFSTAVAGALTGLFLFPHYFVQAAPALALAAACGVEALAAGRRRRAAAVLALALWPALLAPRLYFVVDARERGLALLYPNPLFETKLLGEEIARRAAPGDRLHVFGSEGALFVYSGLPPATRHTLAYALTLFPRDAQAWREEMAALEAAPPRFVVWSGQPLSTIIASKPGADYRDALRRFLSGGRYDYAGSVRVEFSPAAPTYQSAAPGGLPPFDAKDHLLLFERRSSAQQPEIAKRPNLVTTLGTLHAAMLQNPHYTLRDFIAAVQTYKPDLILNEVRPAFPGPVSGSIDGGIEQSLVYAIAEHLSAKVVPVDWFDDASFQESMREESNLTPAKTKRIETAADGYENDFKSLSILELNGPAAQKKIRTIYDLQEAMGLRQSRERNDRICSNVRAALRGRSGRRIMIIFGLDHKYFIDDCVRGLPGDQLVEVGTWLKPGALSKNRIPPAVTEKSLQNVKASESLLKSRLQSGYYSGEFKGKLEDKLSSYPDWIEALERL